MGTSLLKQPLITSLRGSRELPDLLINPEVIKIGEAHKKTSAQVLLRWIIQRGISTIPKSTNPERLKQNLNIFDFKLSDEEMKTLASLNAGIRVCDFAFFKGMEKHPEFPFKNMHCQ
uniref:NADP-dependent oxidoreductase domain-containing protein n=1 Tax=Megaselia scalaris TaxID=36166 RepID=T1GQ73_MEGSC